MLKYACENELRTSFSVNLIKMDGVMTSDNEIIKGDLRAYGNPLSAAKMLKIIRLHSELSKTIFKMILNNDGLPTEAKLKAGLSRGLESIEEIIGSFNSLPANERGEAIQIRQAQQLKANFSKLYVEEIRKKAEIMLKDADGNLRELMEQTIAAIDNYGKKEIASQEETVALKSNHEIFTGVGSEISTSTEMREGWYLESGGDVLKSPKKLYSPHDVAEMVIKYAPFLRDVNELFEVGKKKAIELAKENGGSPQTYLDIYANSIFAGAEGLAGSLGNDLKRKAASVNPALWMEINRYDSGSRNSTGTYDIAQLFKLAKEAIAVKKRPDPAAQRSNQIGILGRFITPRT